MHDSGTDVRQLPLQMKALAAVMRSMPTGVRRVGRWWELMYRRIGGGRFDECEAIDLQWPPGEQAPVRAGRHGQLLCLNLQDWSERRTYFGGRYYQEDLEAVVLALVREGDQFLDVGSNIGMVSLLASLILGRSGRGFSFEPNPEVYARLLRHFEMNGVRNLTPVSCAISDRAGTATLGLPSTHSGKGTLLTGAEESERSFTVATVTGQEYYSQLDPGRPTFVKVDVEGHEVKALVGLSELLDWPEVFAVIEVNDNFLKRTGASADALFDEMGGHGFEAFNFSLRRGRVRSRLILSRLRSWGDSGERNWRDVLFAKPQSRVRRERLDPLIENAP